MWKYRWPFLGLLLLEFRGRYSNSRLGLFWSLVKPALQFGVFYTVFEYIFKLPIEHSNHAQNIFLGILIWHFFAETTSSGLNSLIGRPNLLLNIRINTQLINISLFLVGLIIFVIGLFIFAVTFGIPFLQGEFNYYGHHWLFAFLLLALLNFSCANILSVIAVYFGDIKQIWEIILIYGIFLTPILYQIPIPESLQIYYYHINLVAFPVEIFKYSFFGDVPRLWNNTFFIGSYCLSIIVLFCMSILLLNRLDANIRDRL